MKILAVHSIGWGDNEREISVDIWRVWRPIRELKKHVDWQIDEQQTFIKGIEKYKDEKEFTPEELEKAAEHLGQYDIIFSSYFADKTPYTLLKVVEERYGTKFVMDVDDHMFAINPDNPLFSKISHEQVWWMQVMVKDVKHLTTTNDILAKEFRTRRTEHTDDSVTVIPNMITHDYKHEPFDHGDEVWIGYFGGSSHLADLNYTNCIPAVQKLMHKYKNIRFRSVNMPLAHYLPVKRHTHLDGVRGTPWITDVMPTLELDIAVIPLQDNLFNRGKSDIKWQESTAMGSITVCSDVSPYSELPDDVTIKVEDTQEAWYNALEKLVLNKAERQKLYKKAKAHLDTMYIEENWKKYKEMFERVAKSKE